MIKRVILAVMAASATGCGHSAPAPVVRGASAGAVSAMAATVDAGDRARFRATDRDGDGTLSAAELPDFPAEAIAMLDGDGDGRLSYAEAMSQAPSTRARAEAAVEARRAFEAAGAAPQFAEEAADSPRRAGNPVVLVPGYLDFQFFFALAKKRLEAEGRTTTYVDCWPNIADITVTARVLANRIRRVQEESGAAKVDVLAHSMGGLITRYYIKNLDGARNIAHMVTLATPHHGTYVSFLGPGVGADQMHPGSPFLKTLNAEDETPGDIRYTSVRSGLDEIVIPHSSMIWQGADNHLAPLAMHGTIFVDPTAWKYAAAGLKD